MTLRVAVPQSLHKEGDRVLASLAEGGGMDVEAVEHATGADLALRPAHETLPTEERLRTRAGEEAWSHQGSFAVLGRSEPRDALVAPGGVASLAALAQGARVGLAGALRREMLGVHRDDLRPVEIGDVAEVGGLMRDGKVDAWIDAVQVVRAAGLGMWIGELLEPTEWATAGGRGSLLLVWTGTDEGLRRQGAKALAAVDDSAARVALRAERLVMDALEVTPDMPLGVMARPHGPLIRIRALVPAAEGRRLIRAEISGRLDDVEESARSLADELRKRGALDLLAAAASA